MALVADDAGKAGEHVDKGRAANGEQGCDETFPRPTKGCMVWLSRSTEL